MDVVIRDKAARKIFNEKWTPELLSLSSPSTWAANISCEAANFRYCLTGIGCGAPPASRSTVPSQNSFIASIAAVPKSRALDPDHDSVFLARKGYYRRPVMAALAEPPQEPMALIAAEHTAQLNAPQNEDVFSKAEENELLFQDVAPALGKKAHRATAIDVLSSTTTMEVGIDIGALSGVALRNMPPGRANYQQRAGRAGRRGNAVATVVAFGSADSHDEHYFAEPDGMITGDVIDPKLTLDNREIIRRHIRAFLLQNYHQDRIPGVIPGPRSDLFSVLGSVADFRAGTAVLNMQDFNKWLSSRSVLSLNSFALSSPGNLSQFRSESSSMPKSRSTWGKFSPVCAGTNLKCRS